MRGMRARIGVLLLLSLVATACNGSEAPKKQFASGGTFTIIHSADPGNLDPHMSVNNQVFQVDSLAYDTLVHLNADGKVESGLASRWEETPNSVTFTLNQGITCADGSPLTASDVAANFTFITDPKNESPLLGIFLPEGLKVTADDTAGTVTLSSEEPVPFFLQSAGANLFIVCKSGLADRKLLARATHGTGPFKLTEAVPNDHYTFTGRKDYRWGPAGASSNEAGFPATVVIRIVESEATAANLLLSGKASLVSLQGPDRQRVEQKNFFTRSTTATSGEFFFNQTQSLPAAALEVRQALVKALDLDEVRKVLTRNTGVPSQGLVGARPRPCPGNSVKETLDAGKDAAEAGRLLDAAGWTLGSDGSRVRGGKKLTLRLLYTTAEEGTGSAMELIRSELQKLGVAAQLKGVGDSQFQDILFGSGAWDLALAAVNVNFPSEIVPFVSGVAPPDGTNFSHVDNPDYVSLVAEAQRLSGSEACSKWDAAEKALFEQVNILPFADNAVPYFGNRAEFELSRLGYVGASLRLLKA